MIPFVIFCKGLLLIFVRMVLSLDVGLDNRREFDLEGRNRGLGSAGILKFWVLPRT